MTVPKYLRLIASYQIKMGAIDSTFKTGVKTGENSNKSLPPGDPLSRWILQVWAAIIATYFVVKHMVIEKIRRFPKLDMTEKRTGQVCVLTGASRGIRFEILKKLLELDYTVICGVRNFPLVQQKVEILRKNGVKTGHLKLFNLDLLSLHSVKSFAEQVLNCPEAKRINLLINNAGIYQREYEISEDSLEAHFQVNYLAGFYLTNLLLPRIKATAKQGGFCHIVNTSSVFHHPGQLQFDNLATKKLHVPMRCYFDTKLCQVLHSATVQEHLDHEGFSNIQMYSVHPGVLIPTDIWTSVVNKHLFETVIRPLAHQLFPTAECGANAVLYPALAPDVSKTCGGKYFEIGKLAWPNPKSHDCFLRKRLLDFSNKLLENI